MPPRTASWMAGPPGAIIGLYVTVLAASLYAYAASGTLVCLKFLILVCVTIALTYVEQLALIHLFGTRGSSYLLQCSGRGDAACTVRAKPHGIDGLSPGAKGMWDMPSAAAQLALMTATFWTMFVRAQRDANDKKHRASAFGMAVRTFALWCAAATVVLASFVMSFSTFAQLAAGVIAGVATGKGAWLVSNGGLT